MKIIKIGNIDTDLTVDSTMVSVDSTNISADMITYSTNDNKITLIPKLYPNIGESLNVILRHEINNKELNVSNQFFYRNEIMYLYIDEPTLKDKEKYEINIFHNGENIYKGKLLVVNSDTDIQNYSQTKIINNKIKY